MIKRSNSFINWIVEVATSNHVLHNFSERNITGYYHFIKNTARRSIQISEISILGLRNVYTLCHWVQIGYEHYYIEDFMALSSECFRPANFLQQKGGWFAGACPQFQPMAIFLQRSKIWPAFVKHGIAYFAYFA